MNTPKAPWLKYFGDMPAHLDYPKGSMYEAVRESAITKKKMNSVAYEFQGKKTNYKQFLNKIEVLGKAYKSIGIDEGDMVTVCMPNTPQGVDTFYALNRIGAVPAMIHPLSAVGEIAFYINSTQSKAVLVVDLFYEKVLEALKQVKHPVKVVVAHIKDELPFPLNMLYPLTVKKKPAPLPKDNKNVIDWSDFISGGKKVKLSDKFPKAEDTAVILFSGGTTGTSKGIKLTNLNMNALAAQVAANAGFTMEGLRMFSVMPLFHGFGLGVGIHTALMASGTCIIIPQFTIKTYARDV